jgi:hypothetical protein
VCVCVCVVCVCVCVQGTLIAAKPPKRERDPRCAHVSNSAVSRNPTVVGTLDPAVMLASAFTRTPNTVGLLEKAVMLA